MSSQTTNNQSYSRGVFYVLLAGVFLSSAGILVRSIEHADAWTVLFYRSVTFSVTVFLFMWMRDRHSLLDKFRAFQVSDLVVSVALAAGFIYYVLSLYHTSVANTVLLLSTGPFFSAVLGWVLLRERVAANTWFAMLVAAIGIAVMVSGGLGDRDWQGVLYALIAVLGFAVMVVWLRRVGAQRDMMPATAMAGLVAAVCCLPFVSTLAISQHDLLVSICLGSVQVGFGFILITLASRSVPSAQVPLLALGETALAPFWVWWLLGEVPVQSTLIGGGIVLAAVVFQGYTGINAQRMATLSNKSS